MIASYPLSSLPGKLILAVILSVLFAMGVQADAPRSIAHENSVPDFVSDGVPSDPPAPGPERITPPVPVEPEPPVISKPEPGQVVVVTPVKPEPEVPLPPVVTTPVKPESVLKWIAPASMQFWFEKQTVSIKWESNADVKTVKLLYSGEKCRLGGKSRGHFSGTIGGDKVSNKGSLSWKVPWLDGPKLTLRLVGYDSAGKQIGELYRDVQLLPAECALEKLPGTCIVVVKRLQRLWYMKDKQIKRMHLVSTAAAGYVTPRMKPGGYYKGRGATGKIFNKALNPYSSLYEVHMPYWMGITASGTHGLHATSPALYRLLGRPASHGCVRQHRTDARILYEMVRVGTAVYVL